MKEHKLDRRRFFNGLLYGGIAALVGSRRSLAQTAGQAGPLTGVRLPVTEPIRCVDSASVIGRAYLQQIEDAVDADDLYADLLRSMQLTEDQISSMSIDQVHQRLRDAVRSDFAAGLTVKLNGWILSQTEARVTALIALG